jgi:hypothetical protein
MRPSIMTLPDSYADFKRMIRAHPQMVDTYVHLKDTLLTDDRSSKIESEDHRPRAG